MRKTISVLGYLGLLAEHGPTCFGDVKELQTVEVRRSPKPEKEFMRTSSTDDPERETRPNDAEIPKGGSRRSALLASALYSRPMSPEKVTAGLSSFQQLQGFVGTFGQQNQAIVVNNPQEKNLKIFTQLKTRIVQFPPLSSKTSAPIYVTETYRIGPLGPQIVIREIPSSVLAANRKYFSSPFVPDVSSKPVWHSSFEHNPQINKDRISIRPSFKSDISETQETKLFFKDYLKHVKKQKIAARF